MNCQIAPTHPILSLSEEVSNWTGLPFGNLIGVRILQKNVRILLHSKGFAVFFPSEVWRNFDIEIPLCFPQTENTCWIARKDFTFIRVDINRS
jgi:hypothetical protein